jgi:glycosyltransferase involved in cell wall biosynthesis
MVAGLPGLDGERRQSVAKNLWRAWRHDGRVAALLTGFSGVGKTERVIAPLVAQARQQRIAAIQIDVPAQPTDLERELLARASEALLGTSAKELAGEVAAASNLEAGLQLVLRSGGLVVVDEFQRLVQSRSAVPIAPFSDQFGRLAHRARDGGCLWLVSNRAVDPVWTEPFHAAILEAPDETRDAIRIVVEAIATADANVRLPEERREEVARRFGANPRALRLLGVMLRFHDLGELIGPPRAVPTGLGKEELANDIERSLLVKARAGLSNAANELMRELTILTEPAPMELIEAVGRDLGEVGPLLRELQERFLVEQWGGLRQVHPVVSEVERPRLLRDGKLYRSANLNAGRWYASRLATAGPSVGQESSLALNLAGAHYHLMAAGAHADLQATLDLIRPYIERRFNWVTRPEPSAAERDAQISLLEIFLEKPGAAGVESHLARLLKLRGGGNDLSRALSHAERGTVGQDSAAPWVLRLQLEYLVHGPEAAAALGRQAAEEVDPAKNLPSVYQFAAAALNHAGHDDEAVALSFEGAERCVAGQARVIEEAVWVAAAMPTDAALTRVRDWTRQRGGFEQQLALAEIIFEERNGNWQSGAERARIASRHFPNYLHLTLHEAFCWLGAGKPEEAQRVLDAFPGGMRWTARRGSTWLAALVAARNGDTALARDLAALYLESSPPTSLAAVERTLLRKWDTRVSTLGEANPALVFPILPASLSGLDRSIIRPQHGPPVLPQHSVAAKPAERAAADRLRTLAIGTEWTSGEGGLSTFNRQLCLALADAGVDVACVVINATPAEIDQAGRSNVRLISAKPTTGSEEREWLARRPTALGADYAPDFIIGHGRITGPAALRLAEDFFPGAKRLHFVHMAPDEIEWHKLDREASAGLRAEDRTRQELELGRTAHRVVAIGPRLQGRYSRDLHPFRVPEPLRFDPGFDPREVGAVGPPGGPPWKVLLLGRAEDCLLKGIDIAARALGRVVRARDRRDKALPAIEFAVRGAKPEDVDVLREQLVGWADSPLLQVVVRAYTAEEDRLDHDLGTSSLVLMPSRREGFGLVGLEAIVGGVPVLVSSNSGLAQMLRETLDSEQAARVIVETTGDEVRTEADAQEWEQAIDGVLRYRDAAFRDAAELREALGAHHTWRASVELLLSSLWPQLV